MTRLSSYQKKQFQKRVIFFTLSIITLIVILVIFGMKLLISATLFISGVTSNDKSQTTEKNDIFYGSLNIDELPVATNSAKMTVSGTATNFEKVQFFLNNQKVKEISLKSSESFTEEIGDLKIGDNEIYFKALTKDEKNQKKSDSFKVIFKNEKPKLEILEPADNTKTRQSSIKVAGTTDKDIYIKVNRLPLVVDSEGKFQTNVNLGPGDNKIEITAEDNAGNIETKTITINYQKDE